MSSIVIITFGTNQSYENPHEIISKYIKSHNIENAIYKRESSVEFMYQLTQSDPTKIKLIFLKNLEKAYPICKKADAHIIFIDLENVDALDKLNNIIDYINEHCSDDVMNYIIGKYNTNEDKIKSLNENNMNNKIKERNIRYIYKEICTEPKNTFEDSIEYILQMVQNEKMKKLKNISINKYHDFDTQSKCIIY